MPAIDRGQYIRVRKAKITRGQQRVQPLGKTLIWQVPMADKCAEVVWFDGGGGDVRCLLRSREREREKSLSLRRHRSREREREPRRGRDSERDRDRPMLT